MGRFLQTWCVGSALLLIIVGVQGLLATAAPPFLSGLGVSKLSHVLWGFAITVVVIFAHTITMFYFIGTGSAVKGEARKIAALLPLYERTRKFKARTSGILTLAPLLLMAASIAGAGVAGGSVSPAVHLWMEVIAVLFNVWTLLRVAKVIQENILLMEEAERIISEERSSA